MNLREENLTQTLYKELFTPSFSKAQRTQIQIIEAAIKSYATNGVEKSSFDQIAKIANVSRPLISHYFASREELFLTLCKYIRANFQKLVIEAIRNETDPIKQLEKYITASFSWVDIFPNHVKVWSVFFHYCGFKKEFRDINTNMVNMGHERIIALIQNGIRAGVFTCSDPFWVAKIIQITITGALICAFTENFTKDYTEYKEKTVEACLKLLK